MASGRRSSAPLLLASASAAYLVLSRVPGGAFSLVGASGTPPSLHRSASSSVSGVNDASSWLPLNAGSSLAVVVSALGLAAAGRGARKLSARPVQCCAQDEDVECASRRSAAFAAFAAASFGAAAPALAEAPVIDIDLPPKIKENPYELLGMEDPDNEKADKKEFYMKRNYKEDTYQLVKHMKISASIDKGTENMERFQKRVKEEMNDWVALYRRQDAVVGRQSYYALYSAVNTLSSHMMSYGPKFPFPNKRRPRFYQLIAQTEKYLEKGK